MQASRARAEIGCQRGLLPGHRLLVERERPVKISLEHQEVRQSDDGAHIVTIDSDRTLDEALCCCEPAQSAFLDCHLDQRLTGPGCDLDGFGESLQRQLRSCGDPVKPAQRKPCADMRRVRQQHALDDGDCAFIIAAIPHRFADRKRDLAVIRTCN